MLAESDQPERRSSASAHAVAAAAPFAAHALRHASDIRHPAPAPPAVCSRRGAARWHVARRDARATCALAGWLADLLPKGLYARALIIIIAPIVVLEGVVAFVFMERHWEAVTRRLSEATARDIAALIDVYERRIRRQDRLRSLIEHGARPAEPLDAGPAAWRSAGGAAQAVLRLCSTARCRDEIRSHVQRPFWIDTVGQSRHVEIRVKHDNAILRFIATRARPTPPTRTSSCSGWWARR